MDYYYFERAQLLRITRTFKRNINKSNFARKHYPQVYQWYVKAVLQVNRHYLRSCETGLPANIFFAVGKDYPWALEEFPVVKFQNSENQNQLDENKLMTFTLETEPKLLEDRNECVFTDAQLEEIRKFIARHHKSFLSHYESGIGLMELYDRLGINDSKATKRVLRQRKKRELRENNRRWANDACNMIKKICLETGLRWIPPNKHDFMKTSFTEIPVKVNFKYNLCVWFRFSSKKVIENPEKIRELFTEMKKLSENEVVIFENLRNLLTNNFGLKYDIQWDADWYGDIDEKYVVRQIESRFRYYKVKVEKVEFLENDDIAVKIKGIEEKLIFPSQSMRFKKTVFTFETWKKICEFLEKHKNYR